MGVISALLDKIRNSKGATGNGATGTEMRVWLADILEAHEGDLETLKSRLVVNAVELFGGVDSSSPWFIFDSTNFTIKVNADLYAIVNNERALINPSTYPNLITYEVGTTATKALVYDTNTKALQCISYTGVSYNHWVLFYFNGRAYQLIQPTNFSRRFPYQVDGKLYNL